MAIGSEEEELKKLKKEYEDLPSTDLEIEAHVHFGMTGSFPMRVGEIFFVEDGLYLGDYSYITPLFGIMTRQHKKDAKAMGAVYKVHGLDEVLLQVDRIKWIDYSLVDEVVMFSGGRFARPKVTIYLNDGKSYAYRVHEDMDLLRFDELKKDLSNCGEKHGFKFKFKNKSGILIKESLKRFLDHQFFSD